MKPTIYRSFNWCDLQLFRLLFFIDIAYKSDESNQNPEEKIGIIVKSTMTNLTDQDIVTLIEQHMLNLRLLTNVGLVQIN